MRDPLLSTFRYVDSWSGRRGEKWVRSHASQIPADAGYVSIQLFSSEAKHPKEPSYFGAWWDLDSDDLEKAHEEERRLVRHLLNIVPEEALRVKFSGRKGFHTYTAPTALGITPKENLQAHIKDFSLGIATTLGLSCVDDAVYSSHRLVRITGSRHDKSGKVAIPLSPTELLRLSTREILDRATKQEPNPIPLFHAWARVFPATGWIHWEPYEELNGKPKEGSRNELKKGSAPLCLLGMQRDGIWQEGTQNKAAVVLASLLKARGDTLEQALTIATEWARRVPLTLTSKKPLEIERNTLGVVRAIYKGESFFSCSAARSLGAPCNREECTAIQTKVEAGEENLVKLGDMYRPEMVGKFASFKGQISAVGNVPKAAPSLAVMDCRAGSNPACSFCPVIKTGASFDIGPDKRPEAFLDLIMTPQAQWKKALMSHLRIPSDCEDKKKVFKFSNHSTVSVTHISPLEGERHRANLVFLPGHEVQVADHYQVTAATVIHPKTNEMVQVGGKAQVISRAWEEPLTENDLRELEVFRDDGDLAKKIEDIYAGWERAGALGIHGRYIESMMMGLPWLSPLKMLYEGRPTRAALHILAFGDTGQAKSAIFERWMSWFGAGNLVDSEASSVAGLTAGVEKLDGSSTIRFGEMVRCNGEMLGLDEWHAAPKEMRGKMSGTISSGFVRLTKIAGSVRAEAMLRLIFMANAVDKYGRSRRMNELLYPVEWVEPIMSSPEDVRRLDYAIAFASSAERDVFLDTPEKQETPYHQKLSKKLLRWVWQLPPVPVSAKAVKAAKAVAKEFCTRYSKEIKLCEPGDMSEKICRVGLALAANTYNHKDGVLVVEPRHMEFAAELIETLYCSPDMKYDAFSVHSTEGTPSEEDVKLARATWSEAWIADGRIMGSRTINKEEATETLLHHLTELKNEHFTLRSVRDISPGCTETAIRKLFAAFHRLGWTQPAGDKLRITEAGVAGINLWREAWKKAKRGDRGKIYATPPIPDDVLREFGEPS